MKRILFYGSAFIIGWNLAGCGKDVPPAPGPKPLPVSFEVSGNFIEVKGTVKKGSVAEAKAAVTMAVRDLER